MKLYTIFFFSILLFYRCGEEKKAAPDAPDVVKQDTIHAASDHNTSNQPAVTNTDSVYPLEVNGKNYELVLSQNYPSQKTEGALATTLFIIDTANADTLYRDLYEFNEIGELRNPAPGHYWIGLLNSGGGSGYSATLFNIRIGDKIEIQPLFDFDELSYWKTNALADEVLFFEGIWNMNVENEKDLESHFAPHRQSVSEYSIKSDTVILKEIGISKYKYDLFDNADTDIGKFQEQEKKLNKNIKWSYFR
jgi:hypothetical protein